MITKKVYTILKPTDIYKWSSDYSYTELKIVVEKILLFGLITIYKKQSTVSYENYKKSYSRPKTIKLA